MQEIKNLGWQICATQIILYKEKNMKKKYKHRR